MRVRIIGSVLALAATLAGSAGAGSVEPMSGTSVWNPELQIIPPQSRSKAQIEADLAECRKVAIAESKGAYGRQKGQRFIENNIKIDHGLSILGGPLGLLAAAERDKPMRQQLAIRWIVKIEASCLRIRHYQTPGTQ